MFQFKQFTIHQEHCAQKVSELACIQGAWTEIPESTISALDIGCGTGLLSLMLAQRYHIEIDAIEIDEPTYLQAKSNIEASPFKHNIHVYHMDIRTFEGKGQYDFIISNPPFFENQLQANSRKDNLARHSSSLSLKELLTATVRLLSDRGQFCVLFPFQRMAEFELACTELQLYPLSYLIPRHSKNHEPKVFVALYSKQKMNPQMEELLIKENGKYSERMRSLMSDYYTQ